MVGWEAFVRGWLSFSPLVKLFTGLAVVVGAVVSRCLFSASLGHLLLRMSALWHQDKLTGGEHKPSEVKLAVTADSRLMEGVPELVVGLVESATCCGR